MKVVVLALMLAVSAAALPAQQLLASITTLPDSPGSTLFTQQQPAPTGSGTIAGTVTDTDAAAISNARVTLEDAGPPANRQPTRNSVTDANGVFNFSSVAAGSYIVRIAANGFASWKISDVIVLHEAENFTVPSVELGVEEISTTVSAISIEDLAEQQITAEVHQRILGVLPNFYVSYVPNAAPLTRKQKFKLAVKITRDPVTFFTTGITAGIEQSQGDFAGYGGGFGGYASRYAATYGDRISSTFLGAALLPSLLHQDPRYFYRGHGKIIVRALYAISTVAVCKGDNGHWQPNYSNIFGNLGAAGISSLYYPNSDQHDVQVTVTKTLLGVGTGAIGVLFQEFLLRHLTHGAPPKTSANP